MSYLPKSRLSGITDQALEHFQRNRSRVAENGQTTQAKKSAEDKKPGLPWMWGVIAVCTMGVAITAWRTLVDR